MPMYALVLWHQGDEDVRITDQPVSIGQTLSIDSIQWFVEAQDLPHDPNAAARYVCSRRAATSSNRDTAG
jgi:hypothetical protein